MRHKQSSTLSNVTELGGNRAGIWIWLHTASSWIRCSSIYPVMSMSDLLSLFESWVQFGHSVVSNSLWPHEPQHPRPPCLSPTPRVHSNPCPLSWWCHPTISFSVVPFSSCPQFFPESGSFQMSQLFASDGQSIRVSASASVLPMNIQDWFLKWSSTNNHWRCFVSS